MAAQRAMFGAIILACLAQFNCQMISAVGVTCNDAFPCPVGLFCDSTQHCQQGSAPPDGGAVTDAGPTADSGTSDSGVPDAGTNDGGRQDAGLGDAGRTDGGSTDAGPRDAGPTDAGPSDAGGTPCGGATCACNGELVCSMNQCVADTDWTQWPAPPDAPADAQYSVSNGDVTDTATGLVWQQTLPTNPCPSDGTAVCTFVDAQSYCAGLSYGGFSTGWRLPTFQELLSIVDLANLSPMINQHAFPNTPMEGFWTSTQPANMGTGYAWFILFADVTAYGDPVTNTHRVRCVR